MGKSRAVVILVIMPDLLEIKGDIKLLDNPYDACKVSRSRVKNLYRTKRNPTILRPRHSVALGKRDQDPTSSNVLRREGESLMRRERERTLRMEPRKSDRGLWESGTLRTWSALTWGSSHQRRHHSELSC